MMKENAGKRLVSVLTVALLIVMQLLGCVPLSVYAAEDGVQSNAPNAGNCIVYNYTCSDIYGETNGLVPTLYMWNLGGEATYRVYNSQTDGDLIGMGTYNPQGACCAIPLDVDWMNSGGGTVYVSCQSLGMTESDRVAVPYTDSRTPSVSMEMWDLRNNVGDGSNLVSTNSKNVRRTPGNMVVGNYYVADIVLNNITKVQSVTLPIKYDPTVLELTALSPTVIGGTAGYKIGNPVKTNEEGVLISPFMIPSNIVDNGTCYVVGGNPSYGIGVYSDLFAWGAKQDTTGSSQWRQTPYVNTETGLIKLEFSSDNVVDLSHLNGSAIPSYSHRVVRLYFKCLAKGTGTWGEKGSPLYFASTDDIPAGITDLALQQRYHHISSPNGYRASIQSLNLLAPPPSVKEAVPVVGNLVLTAEQVYELPQSLSTDDRIKQMLENTVKVYNYTNYTADPDTFDPGLLDFGIDDYLILTPSNTEAGAAKKNDKITVYVRKGSGFEKIAGPETVDNEGGIAMRLGTSNLSPDGGSVYVTVTRSGEESAKVEIPYEAEMGRNVYFDLKSSGYDNDYSMSITPGYKVKAGDQLRLDIYFNNFSDLLSYTFHIRFNPSVLQAADSGFHKLGTDGYIAPETLADGTSCLKTGVDLTGITLNEQIAYNAYTEYKAMNMSEAEAMEIMDTALPDKIDTVAKMDAAAAEIYLKLSFGDDLNWDGGLMFTGPARPPGTNGADDPGRDEDALYPYVNNYTGVLRLASATLKNPPIKINKTGVDENGELTHGYHFLSVYFTAVTSGETGLEINGAAERRNGVEKVSKADGTELILSGPGRDLTTAGNVCDLPFMAHWSVSGMSAVAKDPVMWLKQGNKDNTVPDLYLYEGYPFTDPGFSVQGSDDKLVISTESSAADTAGVVTRTVSGDKTFDLAPWQKGERITTFDIPEGQFSAEYTITYSYTEKASLDNPDAEDKTVTKERKVYVLRRMGDYNGDGEVNFLDLLVDITAASDLFTEYTRVDADVLLKAILKRDHTSSEPLFPLEFVMPTELPTPDPDGEGSADSADTRFFIEFYAADADPTAAPEPLDPTALPAGSQVIMAVKYENLSAMLPDGLVDTAFAICYNSDIFTLEGFDEDLDDGALGMASGSDAETLNRNWISPDGSISAVEDFISINASDIPLSENTHRVYIHYIDTVGGNYIWENDSGCLAAFKFRVKNENFTDVPFEWLDYGIANDDYGDLVGYNRHTLLDGVTPFQKPQTVLTSGAAAAGFTITGEVVSYNAKNPIYYELYRMGGDGEYETVAAYTGIAVAAQATTAAISQSQTLTISGISEGTYKLVISKVAHLKVTIPDVVIDGMDLDLHDDLRDPVKHIIMGVGDLNADGRVTVADKNIVTDIRNYGIDPALAANILADINGDGRITVADKNIITDIRNYGKVEADYVFQKNN